MRQLIFGILPGTCLLCEAPTFRNLDLCTGCEEDLPRIDDPCPVCGLDRTGNLPTCLQCAISPPPFSHCFAPFTYTWPVDRLVNDFKNHGHLLGGRLLAQVMARAYLQVTPPDARPDLLMPVPLHKSRLRERGFNQSLEIAEVVGDIADIAVDNRVCRRTREAQPQKTLTANQRKRNLRGAFVLDRHPIGQTLAIVDDVVTTGSTVAELARLLLSHGAHRVDVIALARTPLR